MRLSMIELKNISFKYKNGKEVLSNINFFVNDGEVISIIGKNGTGKSTLARIIAGILKPTSGNVLIDDLDVHNKNNFKQIRTNIGIVFQNPDNQILFNNVHDDIEFALKNLQLENKEERIKNSLEMVDMKDYENYDTYKLSLGQKQRVNLAGAIATSTKYLILDEPTTMIDSNGKEKIYDIIKNLHKNGKTIIFITNNINEILLSNRIVVMNDRQIASIIRKEDLFNNLDLLKSLDINIPDIIKLTLLLKENGLNIQLKDYTISELAQEICKNFNS